MNQTKHFINRFVKIQEKEIEDYHHLTNLREMRPMISKLMEHSEAIIINHGKRDMIKQMREMQIERENKLLLQKIASVRGRKGAHSISKTKNIRTKVSLNENYRKQQVESMEHENKKFLNRLQTKRATVNSQKMKKQWMENKDTIERISNAAFNLTNLIPIRMRSIVTDRPSRKKYDNMKLTKTKVTEFVGDQLKIMGDTQSSKDVKINQIPKEEYDIDFCELNPETDMIMNKNPSNTSRVVEERKDRTKTNHSMKELKKSPILVEVNQSKHQQNVQEKPVKKMSQPKIQIISPAEKPVPVINDLPTEQKGNISQEKKKTEPLQDKPNDIEIKEEQQPEIKQQQTEVQEAKKETQQEQQKKDKQDLLEESHPKQQQDTPEIPQNIPSQPHQQKKDLIFDQQSTQSQIEQFEITGEAPHPPIKKNKDRIVDPQSTQSQIEQFEVTGEAPHPPMEKVSS